LDKDIFVLEGGEDDLALIRSENCVSGLANVVAKTEGMLT
jgi:hypothetical protein